MYYNALFDVPNEDGKLRIDMTAQVYIILAEANNVLTVPASALQLPTVHNVHVVKAVAQQAVINAQIEILIVNLQTRTARNVLT